MIDLFLQLVYVALVLAVIPLLVCTLPVWLILLGGHPYPAVIQSSPTETNGHISDAKTPNILIGARGAFRRK